MAFFRVQSVFSLVTFLSLFTVTQCQLPIANGTLADLLKSAEIQKALSQIPIGNGTLKDLLNSTAGQMALWQIYQTLQKQMNWDSILKQLSSPRMKLGACGKEIAALRNDSGKAFKYFDAAGKPESGLAQGNLIWMGSISECQDIPHSHFCFSAFILAVPSFQVTIPYIAWGGCFPKSCSEKNVSAVLRSIDSQIYQLSSKAVYLKNHGAKCPEKSSYSSGAVATLVICGIILLLCLIGTIIDMTIEAYDSPVEGSPASTLAEVELQVATSRSLSKNHSTQSTTVLTPDQVISHPRKKSSILDSYCCEFFLCFSLLRNTKKIFNTDVPPIAITSVNGIRVISISWVVLGHTFLMFVFSPFIENKIAIQKNGKLLSMMPVINGFYSVDSFFFLSGLLLAYTCFRKMEKIRGTFNWISFWVLFYFHRFWRLTPSYMFVILFWVHIKEFLSSTPYWLTVTADAPLCSKYWWTNLLYISNFYPKEFKDQCIVWSWYLATDMQFFVITPLLLICAYKAGWRGVAATAGSLLLISSVIIATIYGYYDLDPVHQSLELFNERTTEFSKKQNQYINYIYSKPYCRIQPYLVGFILGYFIYKKCGEGRRPGWIIALAVWVVAFAVGMTLVYAPHGSMLPDGREWGKVENIIFGTSQRLLWGLALAWVIYACHYGYGGLIQKFLSARFWIPLSRLTYSVYLVHMIVLQFMLQATNGTVYFSLTVVSYYFIAAFVLSYGVGFILSVAIEYPCENLERLALKALNRKKEKTHNVSS